MLVMSSMLRRLGTSDVAPSATHRYLEIIGMSFRFNSREPNTQRRRGHVSSFYLERRYDGGVRVRTPQYERRDCYAHIEYGERAEGQERYEQCEDSALQDGSTAVEANPQGYDFKDLRSFVVGRLFFLFGIDVL